MHIVRYFATQVLVHAFPYDVQKARGWREEVAVQQQQQQQQQQQRERERERESSGRAGATTRN
jgi:hypothetical protein